MTTNRLANEPQNGKTSKRQLALLNLRKILEIKFFRITHEIGNGNASLFVKPFPPRLLQFLTRLTFRLRTMNSAARFKPDEWSRRTAMETQAAFSAVSNSGSP